MYRLIHSVIILVVIAALLFAVFYLEGVLYLEPCPLCMVDRAILILIAISSVFAVVHHSQGVMRWVYTGCTTLFCGVGIAVGARHIWLQNLPPDQVPECGPDLTYMLEVFPLGDVIRRIFTGSGQCAEVSWTFLGLTIPQQTLLLFILLLVLAVFAHGRRPAD